MLLRLNPVEEKTTKIILTFLGIELHLFPRAALTSYNKLSDLSQHEFILLHSWMSEVQNEFSEARIKMSAELVCSGGSREESLPYHSHLLEAASVPWLVTATLLSLLPSSHCLLHSYP